MKAEDLKVGSLIQITIQKPFITKITKTTEKFVWFNGCGYCRLGRTTINKFPMFYKIIEI